MGENCEDFHKGGDCSSSVLNSQQVSRIEQQDYTDHGKPFTMEPKYWDPWNWNTCDLVERGRAAQYSFGIEKLRVTKSRFIFSIPKISWLSMSIPGRASVCSFNCLLLINGPSDFHVV